MVNMVLSSVRHKNDTPTPQGLANLAARLTLSGWNSPSTPSKLPFEVGSAAEVVVRYLIVIVMEISGVGTVMVLNANEGCRMSTSRERNPCRRMAVVIVV